MVILVYATHALALTYELSLRPDGLPLQDMPPPARDRVVPVGTPLLLHDSASALSRQILPQAERTHLPLTERLIAAHKNIKGEEPKPSDVVAWENSIPVVIDTLMDTGLRTVDVLVEFDLPHTNSAVDLVLAGQHPSGGLSYVAIELKQVHHAKVHPECAVAVDLGYYNKYKPHPVRQIQRYCEYMTRCLGPLVGEPERLFGVALLHNARDAHVEELFALPESNSGMLYTLDSLEDFRRILKSRLAQEPGGEAAQALIHAYEHPLPKITDLERHRPVKGQGLVLLDEQFIAFDRVRNTVLRQVTADTHRQTKKKVFIIRGGPGSGKSAVAVELRRELAQLGYVAQLASGSSAYANTLRNIMISRARQGEVGRLTKAARHAYPYFYQFGEAEPDSVDVLICDEAHRIRRTSNDRYTPRERRDRERPQADELMAAAKVPAFFLDDHQSLRPDEVGDAAYLQSLAKERGYEPEVIDLGGIFRAAGSERYQRWVQRLLDIDVTDPESWVPDGRVHLLVAHSPEDLEDFIRARQLEGQSARIAAGFCWPWSKPQGQELPLDVEIGEWRRPWNVKPKSKVDHAPVSDLWATDPRGIDQIGCVYTAQSFEYNWNGVILGPDLVWRDTGFVVQRQESEDPKLRGKSISDEVVRRCIRNAYHVLLTRGITGTVIYSTDDETQEKLRQLIPGSLTRPQADSDNPRPTPVPEGNPVPLAYRRMGRRRAR